MSLPEKTIFDDMTHEQRHTYCVGVVSDWIWNTQKLWESFQSIEQDAIRLPLSFSVDRKWHKDLINLVREAIKQLEKIDVHLYYSSNPELLWQGVLKHLSDHDFKELADDLS